MERLQASNLESKIRTIIANYSRQRVAVIEGGHDPRPEPVQLYKEGEGTEIELFIFPAEPLPEITS